MIRVSIRPVNRSIGEHPFSQSGLIKREVRERLYFKISPHIMNTIRIVFRVRLDEDNNY